MATCCVYVGGCSWDCTAGTAPKITPTWGKPVSPEAHHSCVCVCPLSQWTGFPFPFSFLTLQAFIGKISAASAASHTHFGGSLPQNKQLPRIPTGQHNALQISSV